MADRLDQLIRIQDVAGQKIAPLVTCQFFIGGVFLFVLPDFRDDLALRTLQGQLKLHPGQP